MIGILCLLFEFFVGFCAFVEVSKKDQKIIGKVFGNSD